MRRSPSPLTRLLAAMALTLGCGEEAGGDDEAVTEGADAMAASPLGGASTPPAFGGAADGGMVSSPRDDQPGGGSGDAGGPPADQEDEADADRVPVPDALDEPGEALDAGRPDDPPSACPAGVVCVESLPFRAAGTTVGGASTRSGYACAPDVDESGPEVVYRVEVPHEGFLAVALNEGAGGADADVDVHLLSAEGPESCVSRGHWRAGAWVTPGTYWVVADSWVTEDGRALAGRFELSIALTDVATLTGFGLDPTVAQAALRAFSTAFAQGDSDRLDYAITDFSLHSGERRQFIVDLSTGELLWNLLVTHGTASSDPDDPGRATTFSNVPESHQSSLGLMRSAEIYEGDYGHSFRLDGLEPGYNDRVRPRDIVMHPWEGARPEYVTENGYLQPSWGCPAIDDRIATPVVDRMADGALYFFWYPDGDWSERSTYLQ